MAADAEALEWWTDFPVAATPRPIVLVDGYVHVQQAGFVDGPAKQAFLAGAIESSVDVPAAVLDLLRNAPGNYDGPPLVVRGLHRSTAAFMTDRGPRDLPAYELNIPGAIEAVIVLDPSIPVWWPPTPVAKRPTTLGPATIEHDDHTLHVPTGGGVLTEFLRCEFIETPTAVLARPITTDRPTAPDTAIPLVMLIKPVTGRLRRPLGTRVLINHAGRPMAVLPIDHPANNRDHARR